MPPAAGRRVIYHIPAALSVGGFSRADRAAPLLARGGTHVPTRPAGRAWRSPPRPDEYAEPQPAAGRRRAPRLPAGAAAVEGADLIDLTAADTAEETSFELEGGFASAEPAAADADTATENVAVEPPPAPRPKPRRPHRLRHLRRPPPRPRR